MYKSWDCLSGIYQVEINEKMGGVARPSGITKNNECAVMVDNFLTHSIFRDDSNEEIEIKLLTTMLLFLKKCSVGIEYSIFSEIVFTQPSHF